MSSYCISDLHGDIERYQKFKNILKEDDKYYILGDVIDRGEYGIEILLDIINDSRASMILGNHEYMMLNTIKRPEVEEVIVWCYLNGGQKTFDKYIELPREDREKITDYLNNLPLIKKVEVGKNKYYLTHSSVLKGDDSLTYLTAKSKQIEHVVWDRMSKDDYQKVDGYVLLTGHTFVQHYDSDEVVFDGYNLESSNFIDIDGGLALQNERSSLIVFKMDDKTVQYIK